MKKKKKTALQVEEDWKLLICFLVPSRPKKKYINKKKKDKENRNEINKYIHSVFLFVSIIFRSCRIDRVNLLAMRIDAERPSSERCVVANWCSQWWCTSHSRCLFPTFKVPLPRTCTYHCWYSVFHDTGTAPSWNLVPVVGDECTFRFCQSLLVISSIFQTAVLWIIHNVTRLISFLIS